MKVVEYSHGKDPYIPTEETMFKKLRENPVDDGWVLHELPLAHMINTIGVPATQAAIDKLDADEKKIFVCQHILVDQLQIDTNSVMCSPHASDSNNVVSIPHYPVNAKSIQETHTLFSFLGSTTTHQTRRGLVKLFPENCYDSGAHWGLDIGQSDEFKEKYSWLLSSSLFSICPRGTGISSVRLFESMASGAIPVIIADGYRPPLSDVIDWKSISIQVKENKIKKIEETLLNLTSQEIEDMRSKMIQAYKEYLSPENFHKSIELVL